MSAPESSPVADHLTVDQLIVTVKLFARAKDLAGTGQVTLTLPRESTVAEVRRGLLAACPGLVPLSRGLLFAVNSAYATESTCIPAHAELACFPPVSGG